MEGSFLCHWNLPLHRFIIYIKYFATISIEITQGKTKEFHRWAVKNVTFLLCLTRCWLCIFIKRTAIKILILELNTVMNLLFPTNTHASRYLKSLQVRFIQQTKVRTIYSLPENLLNRTGLIYIFIITDDEKLYSSIRFRWQILQLVCMLRHQAFKRGTKLNHFENPTHWSDLLFISIVFTVQVNI